MRKRLQRIRRARHYRAQNPYTGPTMSLLDGAALLAIILGTLYS